MNTPAMLLYVGDIVREPSFTGLSLAAQGLWLRMLFLMHDACKRGELVNANGMQMTVAHLANIVGRPFAEIETLLAEMESLGTYSKLEDGTIYCRRMRKGPSSISEKRRAAAHARWRCKPDANDAKHAPSFSISSSSSISNAKPGDNSLSAESAIVEPLAEAPEPPPAKAAPVPELFRGFLFAAQQVGMRIADGERADLLRMFTALAPDERLAAVQGIEVRIRTGEYADPHFVPAAQRYLRERRWTARLRPGPKPEPSQKTAEYHRLVDRMMQGNLKKIQAREVENADSQPRKIQSHRA